MDAHEVQVMAKAVARRTASDILWQDLEQEGHLALLTGAVSPWGAMIDYVRKWTSYSKRTRERRSSQLAAWNILPYDLEPSLIAAIDTAQLRKLLTPLEQEAITRWMRGEEFGTGVWRGRKMNAVAKLRKAVT